MKELNLNAKKSKLLGEFIGLYHAYFGSDPEMRWTKGGLISINGHAGFSPKDLELIVGRIKVLGESEAEKFLPQKELKERVSKRTKIIDESLMGYYIQKFRERD